MSKTWDINLTLLGQDICKVALNQEKKMSNNAIFFIYYNEITLFLAKEPAKMNEKNSVKINAIPNLNPLRIVLFLYEVQILVICMQNQQSFVVTCFLMQAGNVDPHIPRIMVAFLCWILWIFYFNRKFLWKTIYTLTTKTAADYLLYMKSLKILEHTLCLKMFFSHFTGNFFNLLSRVLLNKTSVEILGYIYIRQL